MRDRSEKMMAVLMVSLMAVVALAPLAGEESDAAASSRWLYGMGDNASSQQGDGTTDNVTTPTQIGAFENVSFVVNSYNSTFFIDSGKLYGMGDNSQGQMGNGTLNNVTTPTQIGAFENVSFVAASNATAFFIDSGKLYGMGDNQFGQMGNNTTVDVNTPTQVGLFENVSFVAAQPYVTYFIDSGKLYGMGANFNGQMANGQSGSNAKVTTPTQIGDFSNVTLLSIGPDSTFFVDSGKIYGLGRNQYGQMGNSTSGSTNVMTPTQIGDFTNVSALIGGITVLIIDSGKAYGWGYNYNGQLCTGDTNNVTTPTQIGSFENVTGIYIGYSNIYLIDSGKLYGAGGNSKGQLEGTNVSNVTSPKQIGDFTNVRSVSGGDSSTYFIDSGKLYGLGDNSKGQMGDGTSGSNAKVTTPTQIGNFTNVKSIADGNYAGYSAFFIAGPNSVTASIAANEATYGTVSDDSVTADIGTEISAEGNVLTIGSETVTATPTAATSSTYYAFESWSGIPAGGLLTDDITITANFSASAIMTVTLDAGKGSVSTSSLTVIEGQAIGDLPTPTPKPGYTFIGWFDSEGNEVTSETIVTETESFTLYAQYELDDSLKPVKAMTDLLPLIFVVGIIILMIGTAFYYYRP